MYQSWFIIVGIVAPVAIVALSVLAGEWMKLKRKQLDQAAVLATDKAAAQGAHIERLEARMRVLERIATDKGGDLAAQIEDLRDERVS